MLFRSNNRQCTHTSLHKECFRQSNQVRLWRVVFRYLPFHLLPFLSQPRNPFEASRKGKRTRQQEPQKNPTESTPKAGAMYSAHHDGHDHNGNDYGTFRAIYPFTAQQSGDLTLAVGDIITITKSMDASWWTGECNGKVGTFPSNYVEKVADRMCSSSSCSFCHLLTCIRVAPRKTTALAQQPPSPKGSGNATLPLFYNLNPPF